MPDFSLGVIAEHRVMSRYEVYCNRCEESIGTMDLNMIRRAVFNTLGRGGVLCPTCREHACDNCGVRVRNKLVMRQHAGKDQDWRICGKCSEDFDKLCREITFSITGDGSLMFGWDDIVPF